MTAFCFSGIATRGRVSSDLAMRSKHKASNVSDRSQRIVSATMVFTIVLLLACSIVLCACPARAAEDSRGERRAQLCSARAMCPIRQRLLTRSPLRVSRTRPRATVEQRARQARRGEAASKP